MLRQSGITQLAGFGMRQRTMPKPARGILTVQTVVPGGFRCHEAIEDVILKQASPPGLSRLIRKKNPSTRSEAISP